MSTWTESEPDQSAKGKDCRHWRSLRVSRKAEDLNLSAAVKKPLVVNCRPSMERAPHPFAKVLQARSSNRCDFLSSKGAKREEESQQKQNSSS